MPRKAKVTKLADWKKKKAAKPTCTVEQLMGAMLPLQVPSEEKILDEMKNSGVPQLKAFVEEVEKEKRGEKVDFRKFSDL